MYGTSIKAINDVKNTGKVCVLDLEVNGVKSLKKLDLGAKYIFIQPPSMEALEQRLLKRQTETPDSLKKRLDSAQESMEYAKTEGAYDLVVVNDNIEEAYSQLEKFVVKNWQLVEKKETVKKDTVKKVQEKQKEKPQEKPTNKKDESGCVVS